MLSFFKRKDKSMEKHGSDSVVDSQDLLGEKGDEGSSDDTVTTTLSFHPNMQTTTEDRYYFQFLHNQLPPLNKNKLSLSGIELKQVNDSWVVVAFVRNSLPKGIQLTATSLMLIGPDGERLGGKIFDLTELGVLPPFSSRPWQFVFAPADIEAENLPEEGWTLAFELTPKHRIDLADSWEEHLSQEDKDRLIDHLDSLQPPGPGEVNLAGISGQVAPDGNIFITLFIRNGNSHDIHLEQLPLFVEDATGEVVAKGVFQLKDFTIKANSSKPWTFIFPKEMVTKESPDLSRWRVYPPRSEENK